MVYDAKSIRVLTDEEAPERDHGPAKPPAWIASSRHRPLA